MTEPPTPPTTTPSPWPSRLLLVGWLACLVFVLGLGLRYRQLRGEALAHSERLAAEQVSTTAEALRRRLLELRDEAELLKAGLGVSHPTPEAAIDDALQTALAHHPELYGLGVAYAPGAWDPGRRLFAPYRVRTEAGSERADADYDYTDPAATTIWYTAPAAAGRATWLEPFWGRKSQAIIIGIGLPFAAPERPDEVLGVISVNFTPSGIRELMRSVSLGVDGYTFLYWDPAAAGKERGAALALGQEARPDPVFLSHPLVQQVERQLAPGGAEGPLDLARWLVAEPGAAPIAFWDPLTGRDAWLVTEVVNKAGWVMGVVVPRVSVHTGEDGQAEAPGVDALRRLRTLLAAAGAAAVMLGFWLLNDRWRLADGTLRYPGVTVALSTVAALGASAFIGWSYRALPLEADASAQMQMVLDLGSLEQTLARYRSLQTEQRGDPQRQVPTGIFLQSLEFTSSNNVDLTGYLWQSYPACGAGAIDPECDDPLEQGVIFPEAISASLEEAYRAVEGDREIVGWYFEVTLREPFEYSRFPLDRQVVWLRIWHKQFHRDIVLTPHLDA